MLIRNVKLGDLTQIDHISDEAFGHPINPFMLRQYYELFGETYVVAETDGKVVGFCIGGVRPGTPQGWILDLAVLPSHRRKGIGRSLTKQVCALLKEAAITEVSLTVNPNNKAAISLYESFGFDSLGIETDYFGKGVDKLVMRVGL